VVQREGNSELVEVLNAIYLPFAQFGACIVTGIFFSVMVSEAEGWRSTGAKDFG
jgi:hypothetical protein